jgi:hypothetical protein
MIKVKEGEVICGACRLRHYKEKVKSQKKKDKSTPCFEKHAIGPR